jgi:tetratricopeptide (TPR) repeat protein
LPEYQWALLEALRAAGLRERANEVGQELLKTGAANDPRTFALFLATFPVLAPPDATTAVQLAERELTERADVHTHDALAWALAAAGRWTEARVHSERALKEGTEDARLSLHAGIIASHLGRAGEAERHLANASNRQGTLLPSERARLESQLRARVPPREQTASRSDTRIP